MNEKNKIINELRILGFDVSFYGERCVLRRYTGKEEAITLPDVIDEIGDYAFYDNKKIKSVSFGKNITHIGSSAFEDCSALEYISPLEAVNTISSYAFSYTIKLKSITFGDLSEIHEYAFSGSGLEEVIIPSTVKNVSFKAFFACPKLEKAYLYGEDAVYEESSFANCFRLTGLAVCPSCRHIGRRAFSYCKNLTDITMGKDTLIGEDAFEAVPGEVRFL